MLMQVAVVALVARDVQVNPLVADPADASAAKRKLTYPGLHCFVTPAGS